MEGAHDRGRDLLIAECPDRVGEVRLVNKQSLLSHYAVKLRSPMRRHRCELAGTAVSRE